MRELAFTILFHKKLSELPRWKPQPEPELEQWEDDEAEQIEAIRQQTIVRQVSRETNDG